MTPLEEWFLQLKAEIEDLKISQDEKDQIMIKKQEMLKLAKEFEGSVKNTEIKARSRKEYAMAVLDYLRISNDIVKKISEKTSNEFEDEINRLEKKYSDWFDMDNELTSRFYESSKKIDELESRDIETLSSEEVSPITGEARKIIKEIEEGYKKGDEISKELQILSSKISIMTEGFDSLIDFLDGNRS